MNPSLSRNLLQSLFPSKGLNAPAGPMRLPQGAALGIGKRAVVRVQVQAGILWLTEEGKSEDVILQAGETSEIRGAGTTVITALNGPAQFVLLPGSASEPRMNAQRFISLLRRGGQALRRKLSTSPRHLMPE